MFWSNYPTPESFLDSIDNLKVKKPLTLDQLDSIYLNIVKRAQTDARWYQKRQRGWRLGSRLIRLVVFIMLLIGVVVPLLNPNNAQYGYIALVIGGLTFSLEKIFLISQTWIRYMSAEMAIKTLILEFRCDFLITRAAIDSKIAEDQSLKILTKFRVFLLRVHSVVVEETDTWTTQLDTALKMLGDTMKKQTDMVAKKIETIEKVEHELAEKNTNIKSNNKKKQIDVNKLIDTITTD